jgi:Protein of unknown function (DUF2939)
MQDSRRNRIVIDLEPRHSARTISRQRKRRLPRLLSTLGIIVVAIVVLAGVGGYFWWQHYKTTPAYSVAVIVDAVQRGDMATVGEMVDTDKIGAKLIGQVTERATARYGASLSPATRQQVESLIPGLMPRVKLDVQNEVTRTVQQIAQQSGPRPFLLVVLTLRYMVNISTAGDTAKVTATVRNRPTELTLERVGDRWKVTAVQDDAIIQRLVDRLMVDLPAIGTPPGEPAGRDPFRLPRPRRRRR